MAMAIPAMAPPPWPAGGEVLLLSVVAVGDGDCVVDGQGVGTDQRKYKKINVNAQMYNIPKF